MSTPFGIIFLLEGIVGELIFLSRDYLGLFG
jgi:hypothetical protein